MTITNIISTIIARIKSLYTQEPAVVISAAAAAIVFVAANFGIVVDQTSVLSALAYVLPILFGGVIIRSKVSPVVK